MNNKFPKIEGKDYIKNFYRYKLFNEKEKNYLLTLDNGKYTFMNEEAFHIFLKGKITSKRIFNNLQELGFIITEKNIHNIIKETEKRYSFLNFGPSLHMIMPTGRCNLNCVYCFANSPCSIIKNRDDKDKKNILDMSPETAKKTIRFIFQSPTPNLKIEFQGGEPLLAFDIIKLIYKEAIKLNEKYNKELSFALVSNFTLMDEYKADWLINHNISLCTSLDGPKFIHDKNRFYRTKIGEKIGSYDKVTYWIKRINEKYIKIGSEKRVGMLLTITKHSLPYHKEIIDEYLKFGHSNIMIRELTTLGRAHQNLNEIAYSKIEFYKFYKKCLDYIDTLNKKGINVYEEFIKLFKKKIIDLVPGRNCDYESPCGAIINNLAYYSDGSICTCNEAFGRKEFTIGNVNEDWNKVMKQKKIGKLILNSMLENNPICDRCVYKPYCGTCFIETYENYGKFSFHPSKNRKCKRTKFICEIFFKKIYQRIKKEKERL